MLFAASSHSLNNTNKNYALAARKTAAQRDMTRNAFQTSQTAGRRFSHITSGAGDHGFRAHAYSLLLRSSGVTTPAVQKHGLILLSCWLKQAPVFLLLPSGSSPLEVSDKRKSHDGMGSRAESWADKNRQDLPLQRS